MLSIREFTRGIFHKETQTRLWQINRRNGDTTCCRV